MRPAGRNRTSNVRSSFKDRGSKPNANMPKRDRRGILGRVETERGRVKTERVVHSRGRRSTFDDVP